ncbi:ubiquitin-like autophagy protein Apg12-domain-containing protein [Mycena metata]|uniref:Ubiquitin-like protein ATG12 n=1 Tax=Mycena metata TaxID=1033252 RepID=A0AAD7J0E8_9AGAR|nr:ubiquitin-like autophagy protein Apg12-domain-containing protein [Mycena metata]
MDLDEFAPLEQTSPSPDALAALEAHTAQRAADASGAVVMRFMPVGNAPVLKQNVFRLAAASPFLVVVRNLRKKLGMGAGEALFTYINFAFAPAPDEVLGNLYNSFGTQVGGIRQLIVHYRKLKARRRHGDEFSLRCCATANLNLVPWSMGRRELCALRGFEG